MQKTDWATIVPYIISATGAVLVALLGVIPWVSKRKDDEASAAQKIVEAATELVDRQNDDYTKLEHRYAERFKALEKSLEDEREKRRELSLRLEYLAEESRELWRGILSLSGQLNDNNVKPLWEPTQRVLDKYGGNKND